MASAADRPCPWTPAMARRGAAGLVLMASGLLVACENHNPALVLEPQAPPPTQPVSLSRDVQPIFNANCAVAGCHDTASHQQDLILVAGRLYDPSTGIVGVPSTEAPGRLRVEPRDSGASYLVNKLRGTQSQAGGDGVRMPYGLPALPSSQIETIERWIDEGARNN
jgi:hypothetical protein